MDNIEKLKAMEKSMKGNKDLFYKIVSEIYGEEASTILFNSNPDYEVIRTGMDGIIRVVNIIILEHVSVEQYNLVAESYFKKLESTHGSEITNLIRNMVNDISGVNKCQDKLN